ncbi:MAG TPA: pyruvate ferredoxin oxidoreductase subunit gamma [Patescibacteria group bacterium]|nr:pyruvate ferredoxin oxidoreductase subunit gamma [Patescibacteria group bacterium]
MFEIRIHGRGGQGSVTAAELIASAAFYDGKFSQGFPSFGVERRGAPVTAFARIADKFIRLRSQIYEPDFIIVQDSSLVAGVKVYDGAQKGTIVLISSKQPATSFNPPRGVKVVTVPAIDIAIKIIGKPIINTVLLGAFSKISGLVLLKSVEQAIKEHFDDPEIVRKNIKAAREGYRINFLKL